MKELIDKLYKKIGEQYIELEFLKKVQATSELVKKEMVEKEKKKLSVRRQCELLALNCSSLCYEQAGLSEEEQRILEEMDKIYLEFPSYGSRRMGRELRRRGYRTGRLKVRNLMRLLGIEAIYPLKEIEPSSHRASDLSLSTPGGRDRPSRQGLGS